MSPPAPGNNPPPIPPKSLARAMPGAPSTASTTRKKSPTPAKATKMGTAPCRCSVMPRLPTTVTPTTAASGGSGGTSPRLSGPDL
eukprot:10493476-Ditylum_brightwellii.AAC.1